MDGVCVGIARFAVASVNPLDEVVSCLCTVGIASLLDGLVSATGVEESDGVVAAVGCTSSWGVAEVVEGSTRERWTSVSAAAGVTSDG